MSNSEKVVVYGSLAFIAWQLYLQRQCACGQSGSGGSSCVPPASLSPAPGWVQQLSNLAGGNYFDPQCGIWGRCGS